MCNVSTKKKQVSNVCKPREHLNLCSLFFYCDNIIVLFFLLLFFWSTHWRQQSLFMFMTTYFHRSFSHYFSLTCIMTGVVATLMPLPFCTWKRCTWQTMTKIFLILVASIFVSPWFLNELHLSFVHYLSTVLAGKRCIIHEAMHYTDPDNALKQAWCNLHEVVCFNKIHKIKNHVFVALISP